MIAKIKQLESERETLMDRVNKIDKLIESFREICDHKNLDGSDAMVYEGHTSHKTYYKCTICGFVDWY